LSRFTRLSRRILAVSTATFLGAIGAVALAAAPASAHAGALTSKVECVEGKPHTLKVTWTLAHDMNKLAEVSDVQLGGAKAAIGQIQSGATMASKESKLIGSKEYSTDAKPQTLAVTVTWPGTTQVKTVEDTPKWTRFDCGPKAIETASDCAGLTVKILNPGAQPRKYEVVGIGGFKQAKTVESGDTWNVEVPAKNAGEVKVRSERTNNQGQLGWDEETVKWVKPAACFEVESASTCEDLTITVTNTGADAIKAAITVGGETKEETVEPGDSAELAIDGVDGLVAKLSINGGAAKDYAWAKPANCGGLPVTGTNAGLLAGAALVLVAGGGGLFLLARRRRFRFAA
jgi:hypothetical protein